jgi:chaperonin GroEL
MIEKKARAEDAIHTCRGALQEGIVPGGGVALLRAAAAYEASPEDAGGNLLVVAMCEPAKQIIRNGGYDRADEKVADVQYGTIQGDYGFNSAKGEFCSLYAAAIVDPAKVVITALTKAASIGALLLTTEVLVTDLPEQGPTPQNVRADFRV